MPPEIVAQFQEFVNGERPAAEFQAWFNALPQEHQRALVGESFDPSAVPIPGGGAAATRAAQGLGRLFPSLQQLPSGLPRFNPLNAARDVAGIAAGAGAAIAGTAGIGGGGPRTLSDSELWQMAEESFGAELAPTMYAIAKAESGGHTGAHNQQGEDSVGLWQINRRAWPMFTEEELKTPEGNARAALHVLQNQGLRAWTTYTGGHYLQYLPGGDEAQQMAAQQTPNPDAAAAADVASIAEVVDSFMPDRNDPAFWYADPTSGQQVFDSLTYTKAFSEWYALKQSVTDLNAEYTLQQAGLFQMPDGTFLGIEDALASEDPRTRRLAEEARTRTQQAYALMLDQLNLGEFNAYNTAAQQEGQRLNQRFAQGMDRYAGQLDFDQQNVNRAVQEVNRAISGQQESRQRASLITDTQLAAAPWASGGQTEFGIGDLGAGIDTLARQAGIRPGQPLISFPGTMRIDPGAIMAAEDVSRGVAGPLPLIPGLTADPGQMPGVPNTPAINTDVPASRSRALLEGLLAAAGGEGAPGGALITGPGNMIPRGVSTRPLVPAGVR